MIHFGSKQSQSIFNQNYYENAMANNCKQCLNTHYQPHCHPLPKVSDCVAVYIAGRRTNLVVYSWILQSGFIPYIPKTNNQVIPDPLCTCNYRAYQPGTTILVSCLDIRALQFICSTTQQCEHVVWSGFICGDLVPHFHERVSMNACQSSPHK